MKNEVMSITDKSEKSTLVQYGQKKKWQVQRIWDLSYDTLTKALSSKTIPLEKRADIAVKLMAKMIPDERLDQPAQICMIQRIKEVLIDNRTVEPRATRLLPEVQQEPKVLSGECFRDKADVGVAG